VTPVTLKVTPVVVSGILLLLTVQVPAVPVVHDEVPVAPALHAPVTLALFTGLCAALCTVSVTFAVQVPLFVALASRSHTCSAGGGVVGVGVRVGVRVGVGVRVLVGVRLGVGVRVLVGVRVGVGVKVGVRLGVDVAVAVGVGVG
jgi:hypothetical protein